MLSDSTRKEFWQAVNADDCHAMHALLDQHRELVHERINGEAWEAGLVYDPMAGRRVPAPADYSFSNTALHVAAINGRYELAKLLLERGADANALGYEGNKGLTPATVLAAWEGTTGALRLLLEYGADPNLPAASETPLYTAAEHHFPDKVELLLAHGARHDVFTAAITGRSDLVALYITAYPPLRQARSHKRNRTPEEEAQFHEQHEIVRMLQSPEAFAAIPLPKGRCTWN